MMIYFTMMDGDTNKFETLTAMKELQKERGITDHLIITSFNEYISKGEEDNKIDTCKRYWYAKAKSKKRIPDDFMKFLFEVFEEKFHITRRDIFEQLKKNHYVHRLKANENAKKEMEAILFDDELKSIIGEKEFPSKLPEDKSIKINKIIFNEYLQECHKRMREVRDKESTTKEITISTLEQIIHSNEYVKEVLDYFSIEVVKDGFKQEVYNRLMKLSFSDCTYILNIKLDIVYEVDVFVRCCNILNGDYQKEINKFLKNNVPKSINLEPALIDNNQRLTELKRVFDIEQNFIDSREVQENDNKKVALINEKINVLNDIELGYLSHIIDSFSRTKSEKEMKDIIKKCNKFIFLNPNKRKKLFDMIEKLLDKERLNIDSQYFCNCH